MLNVKSSRSPDEIVLFSAQFRFDMPLSLSAYLASGLTCHPSEPSLFCLPDLSFLFSSSLLFFPAPQQKLEDLASSHYLVSFVFSYRFVKGESFFIFFSFFIASIVFDLNRNGRNINHIMGTRFFPLLLFLHAIPFPLFGHPLPFCRARTIFFSPRVGIPFFYGRVHPSG